MMFEAKCKTLAWANQVAYAAILAGMRNISIKEESYFSGDSFYQVIFYVVTCERGLKVKSGQTTAEIIKSHLVWPNDTTD